MVLAAMTGVAHSSEKAKYRKQSGSGSPFASDGVDPRSKHDVPADHGREKLMGLLNAGDPKGEVFASWRAKELVRGLYEHCDPALALNFVQRLGNDLQDPELPEEARSLGRTLLRWKHQIAAWHEVHVTNALTEAANNLIKRVKRVAFGFRSLRDYRWRSLL